MAITLNVLGTEYEYKESDEKQDNRMESSDGYCDPYAKHICVNNDWNENHSSSTRNIAEHISKVKRHEIVHAFLHESGLRRYYEDELLVDWIAIQFPKMLAAFQKVDSI